MIGAVIWMLADTAPRVLSGLGEIAVDPIVSSAIIGSVQSLYLPLGIDWETVKGIGEAARTVRVFVDVASAAYAAYAWVRNLRPCSSHRAPTDVK